MPNNISVQYTGQVIKFNGNNIKVSEITELVVNEQCQITDIKTKKKDWSWVCNECGLPNYTSALSEDDVHHLGCIACGGDEWHREEDKDD